MGAEKIWAYHTVTLPLQYSFAYPPRSSESQKSITAGSSR